MSILHRRAKLNERNAASGGERVSQPHERERASLREPRHHERERASVRAAAQPAAVPAVPAVSAPRRAAKPRRAKRRAR